MRATLLVDAENVRRSTWPNVPAAELVERCRRWAARSGVRLVVVFDGPAPGEGGDLVATAGAGADDRIVELARSLEGPVWLVTSDRELRRRVAGDAARLIGGGAFVRELLAGTEPLYDPPVEERNREIRLVARAHGVPDESLFELVETPVPAPAEGQVLIRNAYLSVDPYMRGRMSDVRSYVAPFTLGEVMGGGAVGRVAASRSPDWREGDWVVHGLGWREWSLSDAHGLRRIDPAVAPVSTALGVLGMPGMTAWWGITQIGRPQPGETVFVSGAAGAVGSAAAQLAALRGCRVIGSAGSAEKLEWLAELGVQAFDYHAVPPHEGLRQLAPDGIDVYFDNVGGDHLEAAIEAMRPFGRVVACGAISRYSAVQPEPGPRNLFMLFTKRLTVQGFIVSDHYDRYAEFLAEMTPLVRDGRVRYRETVVEGIENAPAAFLGLLRGDNIGKMLVKVGPEA